MGITERNAEHKAKETLRDLLRGTNFKLIKRDIKSDRKWVLEIYDDNENRWREPTEAYITPEELVEDIRESIYKWDTMCDSIKIWSRAR